MRGYHFLPLHAIAMDFVPSSWTAKKHLIEWTGEADARALRRIGIDYRDRRLIGNLYMGQSFKVSIDGDDSESGIIIGRRTR